MFVSSCSAETRFDKSTWPLALGIEFLKKWFSGKYMFVFTWPNGQADFQSSPHNTYVENVPQIHRNMFFF